MKETWLLDGGKRYRHKGSGELHTVWRYVENSETDPVILTVPCGVKAQSFCGPVSMFVEQFEGPVA